MRGQIIKGIGGFYYVLSQGEIHTLKARGSFRKKGLKPIIGDYVEFSEDCIEEILKRKNEFVRPSVSNVTKAIIVLSASKPKPDFLLVDKIIINALIHDLEIVIVVNKCEDEEEGYIADLKKQYSEFKVISCSTYKDIGLMEIKEELRENVSFLVGQSGVGKTSIVNGLFPELNFFVGEISKKLKRGKHTTRHVELVPINELNGAIVDTPGFSFLDCYDTDISLQNFYPEFLKYSSECKFNTCAHLNEPSCKVKEELGKNIDTRRYERYLQIHKELKEMEKNKYD